MHITGKAWDFIDQTQADHYLDLLEGLDPCYYKATYERVSEARAQIYDGSLKQKPGESFAAWRGCFMIVRNLATTLTRK